MDTAIDRDERTLGRRSHCDMDGVIDRQCYRPRCLVDTSNLASVLEREEGNFLLKVGQLLNEESGLVV